MRPYIYETHTDLLFVYCRRQIGNNDVLEATPSGFPQERAHPPLVPPPTGAPQCYPRPQTHSSLQERQQLGHVSTKTTISLELFKSLVLSLSGT